MQLRRNDHVIAASAVQEAAVGATETLKAGTDLAHMAADRRQAIGRFRT